MVVRVVADRCPASTIDSDRLGFRLGPAALDEERARDPVPGERGQDRVGRPGGGGAIGMLGVERQGDPERAHFSTPVITIPRVKKRW